MYRWKIKHWLRNNKLTLFIHKVSHFKRKSNKIQLIFLTYLLTVVISSIFLASPLTHTAKNPGWISYVDSLFTSISAFSDTGLVTLDTFDTWNMFGQVIIAILIFIGGIGIFALKIYILRWIFFRKKTNLNQLELVSAERGASNSRETRAIIVDSITVLLITAIIAGLGLSFYFYVAPPRVLNSSTLNFAQHQNFYENEFVGKFISPAGNWALSFRYGFFHSISALNNAGFDIVGNNSLFSYYHNIELQILFLILLIIGGLGYPVIHDILNYFRFKIKGYKRKYQWQLVTKISITTYLLTTIIGFIILVLFETQNKSSGLFWNNQNSFYGTKAERVWSLLFMSFSSRSAGFATFPIKDLSPASIIILSIMMFIGAGPSSTGGGIRTTTMAIIIIALFSRILGRPSVRAFKRRISDSSVRNSFTVFLTSVLLVLLITLIISSSSTNYSGSADVNVFTFEHYIFETSSAFGTAGLTSGLTAKLNTASKVTMAILMFIGQLGISSTILIWGRKRNYNYSYEYITQDVVTG